MKNIVGKLIVGVLMFVPMLSFGQENINLNKFRQLHTELPTPNEYRSASGAPGHAYWQQQADYVIDLELDDKNQRISGHETITYTNNSPDELTYVWIQLDQNRRAKDSDSYKIQTGTIAERMSFKNLKGMLYEFDGGFKIQEVHDRNGKALPHYINNTMMRVELAYPLKNGSSVDIHISWWYNINDRAKIGGRSGYEYFEEEDNYLYTIAQFFPRMAVYNDEEGWQHKQFLGRGEFTLPFGNYDVSIKVPSDHVVAATGELFNAKEILTSAQRNRWNQAKTAKAPIMIVNEVEARSAESKKATGTKTWRFKAQNVRDFAFASSRKFIWDAMSVKVGENDVMCMSYYPKEGNPLWEKYSTKVVAHTIKTYSKFTVDYNYPVAISVHTNRIGMEYPMICFNGGRPEADGTYSERTKYGMISVIIHEVGHNFFPMIINSDERQWTWMDEGLNTFVQYLTEMEWDRNYPSRRGPAAKITPYMKGDKTKISPIMTNSESIFQFGNNAYGKPATALNILRETVMGREQFDYAFKEYCRRWAFRHPTPADLFRTMEDASAVDLDWFWRGWFYTTDHCDQKIAAVEWFQINSANPEKEKSIARQMKESKADFIGDIRNQTAIAETMIEGDPSLRDFYNDYDPLQVNALDKQQYDNLIAGLDDEEKALLNKGLNFYEIKFENDGGLVMPVILQFEYTDGSKEDFRIPAEIWKTNHVSVSKVFITEKEVKSMVLDPYLEVADTDVSDNYWPPRAVPSRFELFKNNRRSQENPMQIQKRIEEMEKQ